MPNNTTEIECNDHVKVIGNAKGTTWETGYVKDINEETGVLIGYGSNDRYGHYSASGRVAMCDLIKLNA